MAQNDLFKRYLEAGLALTAMTQAKAEAVVKELVKAGEVRADEARDAVVDLLERSRENSERLLETIRNEVKAQITNLGLASKEDVERAERRVVQMFSTGSGRAGREEAAPAAEAPAKKKAAAEKSPAEKSPAKKAAAKKTSAKKTSAKKAAAKKTSAKKATKASKPTTKG